MIASSVGLVLFPLFCWCWYVIYFIVYKQQMLPTRPAEYIMPLWIHRLKIWIGIPHVVGTAIVENTHLHPINFTEVLYFQMIVIVEVINKTSIMCQCKHVANVFPPKVIPRQFRNNFKW